MYYTSKVKYCERRVNNMINNVLALAPVKTVVDLYSRLETKVLLYSSEIMTESLYVPPRKNNHIWNKVAIIGAILMAIFCFYCGYKLDTSKVDYKDKSTVSSELYIFGVIFLFIGFMEYIRLGKLIHR